VCYENPMRAILTGALTAAVLAAAAVAGAAAAKTQPGTTYVDAQYGYAITIPKSWKLVPRTLAGVKKQIADLRQKKATVDLADVYASIISTPTGRSQLTTYRLQAFAYPTDPNTPLLTEVSVGIVKLPRVYTKKDLPAVGATYANALSAGTGSKITVPKTVSLPSGPATFIEGTIPAGTGLQNGIELYLIPHGKRLYELSFQIDATYLSHATLFTSIAQHFKLS
jgi:hypothetical protein